METSADKNSTPLRLLSYRADIKSRHDPKNPSTGECWIGPLLVARLESAEQALEEHAHVRTKAEAENASLRRSVAMLKASYRDERGLARLPTTPPSEVLVWVSAAIDHGLAAATKIAPTGDTPEARKMLAEIMTKAGREPAP